MSIKKDDMVAVITGASKGKVGKVIKIVGCSKVVVEGVNAAKVHQKPSQTSEGGIVTKFQPIHVSNVNLVDPKTKKPTRVKKVLSDKGKQLVSKKTGEVIRNV